MKVVLLADTHVTGRGGLVRGVDPAERLEACVATIQRLVPDADLCVLMGDNVDTPTEAGYRTFLECLKPLQMPIRFLVGNHDDREMFRKLMPDLEHDENGYIQSVLETDSEVLLFLDTLKTGQHHGDYCEEKLTWLKRQLKDAGQKPVYIFMHHPPFATGFWIDHSMVRQADNFRKTLAAAGNVRHVFLGHTHRASSGNWNGIAWTTIHGTCYGNDFELLPAKPNYREGPAQIGIVLLKGAECVLHYHDALEPYPLIAYSGKSLREPEPTA
jgi:3',5'-cyclic AMP phosphodiesterase CpdA